MSIVRSEYGKNVYNVARNLKHAGAMTNEERDAINAFIQYVAAPTTGTRQHLTPVCRAKGNFLGDNVELISSRQNDDVLRKMLEVIGRDMKKTGLTDAEKTQCDYLFLVTGNRKGDYFTPTSQSVTVTVSDSRPAVVAGISVVVDGKTVVTNGSGVAVITGVGIGNQVVSTVATAQYASATRTILVDGNETTTLSLVTRTYAVTFNVTDGGEPVEGITIQFNGTSHATDADGVATFTGVPYGTTDATIAQTVKYAAVADETVVTGPTEITIPLVLRDYNVVFTVTLGGTPQEAASVTYNGETKTTSALGEVTFTGVHAGTSNAVVAESAGVYQAKTQSVVVDANEAVAIALVAAI